MARSSVAAHSWRELALRRIEEIARVLATDADEKTVRRAFRDGYPFGERKYHPYKVWRDCVRKYLAARFGTQKDAHEQRPVITLEYPALYCPACCREDTRKPKLLGGCLLCHELRATWDGIWHNRDRDEAFRLARASLLDAEILADFIEESGLCEVAGNLRKVAREYHSLTHKEPTS